MYPNQLKWPIFGSLDPYIMSLNHVNKIKFFNRKHLAQDYLIQQQLQSELFCRFVSNKENVNQPLMEYNKKRI